MITVYTIAYNEEILIQFMIDHYRSRFPACRIVIYDNMSTDKTVQIAHANGCEIVQYDTNNQIQDSRYIEIKNNCWKDATTDWVLVCDVDELLDINEGQLRVEHDLGATIIRSEGYNMVNMENNLDIASIRYGLRVTGYDKFCLFNKKAISDIRYDPGCHKCAPIGSVIYSQKAYKLYHYIFLNEGLTIEKYSAYAKRLSPENLKRGWSRHYLYTPEQIHDKYVRTMKGAIKLL